MIRDQYLAKEESRETTCSSSTTIRGIDVYASYFSSSSSSRSGVSRQYPALVPTLFPGALMNAAEPYSSAQTTWTAVDVLDTNKTPAINGESFYA